mgnify:CR=1 FL=1|jgi:hypothetical protein
MSGNVKFNGWINDDGSENYKCRAWVNFNGTGTVAIRASGNVSSITDLAVGSFTVNMTSALSDANYSVNVNSSSAFGIASIGATQLNTSSVGSQVSPTTTALTFTCLNSAANANVDPQFVNVAVFR